MGVICSFRRLLPSMDEEVIWVVRMIGFRRRRGAKREVEVEALVEMNDDDGGSGANTWYSTTW